MLFINGKFYTDKGFEEAVLVEDAIIKAIGASKALLKMYPDHEVIDLKKGLVYWGLTIPIYIY